MTSPEQDLEAAQREIVLLREELAETNQGVLALYAELDDKAEELRQVSDLKSRFLSYMSHEFRTPLVSIQSMARLLLERFDGPLSEEQEKQVSFIQSSAQEMSEMVDDLLDLAKVEAGKITISADWFELIDLFAALRGMFKPILTSDAVEVVFEEPVGVPALFTDNQKVAQILRNSSPTRSSSRSGEPSRFRHGSNRKIACACRWRTPASASPRTICPTCSKSSRRSVRCARRRGAAPGWACRSAGVSPNCWVAASRCAAVWARDRRSR